MTQAHVEPPSIPPIKGNYDGKSEKYFIKLKLRRDPTSSTSEQYEFRMYLFDNGDPEEFLLLVHNLNMTLAVTETLETVTKIQ